MLAIFRRALNTWAARLFFLVLIASFALWGVADVIRNLGAGDGSAATVAGRRIELPEFQQVYRRQLAQVTRMFGTEMQPTPAIRRSVAEQALAQLVTQAALDAESADLGLAVPDEAVRRATYAIPGFQDPSGNFSRPAFDRFLSNAGLTDQRFIALMRTELATRQVLEAVRAGADAPDAEARAVFAFQQEKRVVDAVELSFAAAPPPDKPSEEQVQRWYDNHPDSYRTPELRRIMAVVLSPQTVGRDIEVTEDEMRADYAQHQSEYDVPEHRTVRILQSEDEAQATKLAGQLGDADWAGLQHAATAAGGSAIELADATRGEFPSTTLADAVFAAQEGVVQGPTREGSGWRALLVTHVTPGVSHPFEEMREEIRARVAAGKAADLMDDRANKVETMLAAGTPLDRLYGDMGLAPVTGTLDAQGRTASGEPAPIPGPPELRPALVTAAFNAKVGDAPHLVQAPNAADGSQSYYAVSVLEITPPAVKPLEEVRAAVEADWTADAVREIQNKAATAILVGVQGGQSLADAALVAGVPVRRLPPVGRSAPVPGVPATLVQPLFGMKQGEATMVEDGEGFLVAQLAQIDTPNPDSDPIGFGQLRDSLNRAVGDDAENVFAAAVRDRAKPRVNQAAVDSVAQAD